MKWINSINQISNKNSPGNCPVCGSDNTDYTAKVVFENYGYMIVWCNDCKHACYISRMVFKDDIEKETNPPKDLIIDNG